ncbi:hypothetical protein SARC_11656 [Sphaeroforma arctica JP610]|uniref:Uncharacterized protein n=1 Tax=Sphaeroforma arctica JP610 TaxID=667725 RepID=A0A0L0FH69_9EUKA|nr:hypothetical protein SARC_11656 [Sphaeroforma arctica JP610]KNC75826.1 hypothetical protein SARC_11656 [Sphaeroforma arctica JP610]|eukprot:XP_014149728.1 hypothetical protein SARC_11656 [Sphaeroforma arctica JP610]
MILRRSITGTNIAIGDGYDKDSRRFDSSSDLSQNRVRANRFRNWGSCRPNPRQTAFLQRMLSSRLILKVLSALIGLLAIVNLWVWKYHLFAPGSCLTPSTVEREIQHNSYMSLAQDYYESIGLDGPHDHVQLSSNLQRRKECESVRDIQIQIITRNRKLPYIKLALWSLLHTSSAPRASNDNEIVPSTRGAREALNERSVVSKETCILESLHIGIINTQEPSEAHIELARLREIEAVDVVDLHPGQEGRAHTNTSYTTLYQQYVNEHYDYLRTLQACKESARDWCLVVEDDAMATSDLALVFHQYILDSDVVFGIEEKVGMIKLYQTSKQSNDIGLPPMSLFKMFIYFLLALAVIAYTLSVLTCLVVERRLGTPSVVHPYTYQSVVIVILVATLFTGMYGARQYYDPLSPRKHFTVVEVINTDATVAIAFPRHSVIKLHTYLEERFTLRDVEVLKPVDHEIYFYFAAQEDMSAYRSMPSMFQHMGAYSSFTTRYRNPVHAAYGEFGPTFLQDFAWYG